LKWSRRQFLKAAGLTSLTAITAGCTDASRKLIPFLNEPEDIVPGTSTWYATTCRECPAGCGMLAKTRDGRVIKVEGNPLHPVNTGKLCARGQASVQAVYNPDRYHTPLRRHFDGSLSAVSWDEAYGEVLEALRSTTAKGPGRVAMLTDTTTGSEQAMIRRFLAACRSTVHVMYEPLGYDAIKTANREVFGHGSIPSYHIENADFLISLSADFLETWVSNVQFARQFSQFREPKDGARNAFIYVGPRLSLTAASADEWIAVPPGGQSVFAFGLLRLLLEKSHGPSLLSAVAAQLRSVLAPFDFNFVRERTGVTRETLQRVAAHFMTARRPLVLAEGNGYQDTDPLNTARAAGLLSCLVPGSARTMDFEQPSALTFASTDSGIEDLTKKMQAREIDVLFVCRANPVYHVPSRMRLAQAMDRAGLIVSISSFPNETDRKARLLLPSHTFLESWGDFQPYPGVHGLLQPVTATMCDTRDPGDILLALGRALKGANAFPEKDFYEVVHRSWEDREMHQTTGEEAQTTWQRALQKGGAWTNPANPVGGTSEKGHTVSLPAINPPPPSPSQGTYSLFSYPTVQFFDGRTANRPLLQELPDPMTAITWGGWVEVHPQTARKLGIAKGDVVTIRSGPDTIKAPVYLFTGVAENAFAVPMSHFHSAFGRYAAVAKVGSSIEGPVPQAQHSVSLTKDGTAFPLAHTDGSDSQHERELARSIDWDGYRKPGGSPDVVLPLPEGFKKDRDFYRPHKHDTYRWTMVIDLDRCIGCGACVVACNVENNVAVVGREQVLKGREMAWLHVQRYFEHDQPLARFLPMMCQHCDEAPCEAVCPVFAPQHSSEGINNQVYNRCIGTRYCNQNCPYKVRRFNWLNWKWDPPLEKQLNPDLTVRTKGVMEKCSFCIQRIVEAKIKARSENRTVRDGEFTTACVQTCPTDAITFGNLLDHESRVSRLIRQSRAYQVLGDLNTKPAVIYLKKITGRFA
jgi:anaerobic selenocysteine-containing dehydrogenase/Fe-S-cluster-containing dehydrogenase component